MIRRLALLILALAASLSAAAAQGFRTPADLVRASLVAEPAAVAGAQPFTLAVRMQVKPGWHVYWRNPGDSGLPPEVTWTLPAGFSAGAIRWPAPERIPIATLMNYGYEGEVTLLVPVTPPPSLDPADPVRIQAKLTYLVCETECVPGSADLALTLPVGKAEPDLANAALFARARAALPVPALWPLSLSSQGDTLRLDFAAAGLKPEAVRNAAYFPYAETAIDNAAAQVMSVDGTGLHLTLARSSPTDPVPAALPGVLTVEEVDAAGTRRLAFAYGDEPVLIAVGALAVTLPRDRAAPAAQAAADGIEPFTQARLDVLVDAHRPVFVDMTAAWCITCAVNEATSLNTKAVRAAMAERGVTYMKGDWTNQNPEITRLLEKHGRSGVPLYLLYTGTGEPQVLPQILTEGTVLAALEAVPAASGRSAALAR
ncbi:protein-disulfide reductase DsbD domain-containing protein [Methylobacterium oryzae]|uniref:protein-disulfide reductase DsbD domain-containing protein n=1 Tax=Methylobacterium oryzae TaxID=334852 RepID=UPI002F3122F4